MKVLVLADRDPKIPIVATVKNEAIELIVTLGDFFREDLLQLEQVTNIPKIGVYGNHCSGNYMPEFGIWNMNLKVWDFKGRRFGGFEGCVRYKENPQAIMYTQEEAAQMMLGFPYVDIFLSHCPPYGINDEPEEVAHQGFRALREYIDNQRPKVWLHGHTDPSKNKLITKYGNTKIEYVFKYKVIEL